MSSGKKRKIKLIVIISAVIALIAATVCICVNIPNEHLIYRGSFFQALSLEKDRKKTLSIGVSSTVPDIHPYNHGGEITEVLKKLVYEPLLDINNDCEVNYCAAKKLIFENNGEQARVQLDNRKLFSDGTKLNADVVYHSYQWFMENETAYNELLSVIKEIQIVDDNTLLFIFDYADFDNIKVFNIPVIYQCDSESLYGSTALGTGCYAVSAITPYSDVTLERNPYYGENKKYDQVVIKAFDYGNLSSSLETKDFDIFLITDEIADKVKENGAYSIYEMGQDTGWYLEYNTENQDARRAVAKLAKGKTFFEKTQDFGVYSKGIVSAYIKPNYYSMLKKGGLNEIASLSFLHNYEAEANGIYRELSAALEEKNVESSETLTDIYEYHPFEFKEDIYIYYGSFADMVNDEETAGFFESCSEMDAADYYKNLEKYLTSENRITPLSKDTVWYAVLAGRNDLGLFD